VPLCATYANAPSGTNIENIEKTCIYGTFGTEMPHGTLAQVVQTSYMKGEFLHPLFIIMSITCNVILNFMILNCLVLQI
jgi:hypothetical protein